MKREDYRRGVWPAEGYWAVVADQRRLIYGGGGRDMTNARADGLEASARQTEFM